jgi:hypothetical protein
VVRMLLGLLLVSTGTRESVYEPGPNPDRIGRG